GPNHHRILLGEPFGRSHTEPRARALIARVVLAPQRAPTGVDQHRVARLQRQLLRGERGLQILRRDLIGIAKHWHAFDRGNVDEHAARDQRTDLLDAQLVESRAARGVLEREAVVHASADHLVAEGIELRANLTHLGDDELFVRAAPVRAGIVARALGQDLEATAGRHGHGLLRHATELEDLAGLDQACRLEHALALHVIARATLVALA